MTSAITSYLVCVRPVDTSRAQGFAKWFADVLATKRVDIVRAGLRSLVTLATDRAKVNRASIAHFREHAPYGKSTPEVIERFERMAAEEEKGAAWIEKLLARIEAEGLPG